jgi:excinuclease ABC subunit A
LERAVGGFFRFTDRVAQNPDDHTPWKKLGQKWHFLRKGFPPGKRVRWDVEVLEELYERLTEVGPQAQFLWNNQMVVRMYLEGQRDPWVGIWTKKPGAVVMTIAVPKGSVSRGQILDLGNDRDLDESRDTEDTVKIKFRTVEDLHRGDLGSLLLELKTARE